MSLIANQALTRLNASAQTLGLHHLPLWSDVVVKDIIPGVTYLVNKIRSAFKTIEDHAEATWNDLQLPLEKLEHELSEPLSRISHMQSVDFTQERQDAYDHIRPLVVALHTEMSQSSKIYEKLQALLQDQSLSKTRRRIVTESIKSMQHAGVHLKDSEKTAFQQLEQALSEKQVTFQNQLVQEAKKCSIDTSDASEVTGLPESFVAAAALKANPDNSAPETGPWSFSVSGASYVTILEQAESASLREKMYRAFKARGTSAEYNNRPILEEILRLRQAQAKLLGFKHFAALSIDTKMAPSLASIYDLLNAIKVAAIPAAEQELVELKAFIAKTTATPIADIQLQPWDMSFWIERYRQAHFNIDQEQIRQYLQVPRVMQSLFDLMQDLFEIEIVAAPEKTVPVWHEDVQFYLVKEHGKVIAGFYMDPYERTGSKREGAWMNNVVDRSEALAPQGETVSLPVALFVMNARQPEPGKPGLFSLDDAETLFHEFGHALQHMLTQVNDGAASGINLVEWDAVEIASQFNENWLYDKSLLQAVSAHVDTGEPLDDAIIDNILQSRHYWAGNATLRQLLFAITDLAIHEQVGLNPDPTALDPSPYTIEANTREALLKTPYLDNETQLPAFGHLFSGGYAAGYYSYKWAEVMAADAYAPFAEIQASNIDDIAKKKQLKQIAQKYRQTILAKGGSRPALEVFREYRGREATVDALLKQQGLVKS